MSATDGEAAIRLQPLGEVGGAPIVLTPGEPALVGRSQTATVCVPHPSVSRSHALLELRGDRWFLTDLGSRHGTQVNGVDLAADRPALIAVGDMLRVGPVTFRVESGAPGAGRFTTTDREARMGTIVERVPSRELEALARLRLDLLMDAAAEIHRAPSEEALAEAIVDLALAGSGYPRAAVLRYTGSLDEVEVLAARDQIDDDATTPSFSFSRSLLGEAAGGHVARMMEDAAPPPGQSIVQLGIQSALCAPIMLDDAVIGLLYLDSRHSERPGQRDSGGFCHAVARLAGLALANIKRADLAQRQQRLEKDLTAAREAQSFLLPDKKGVIGPLNYAMRSTPGRFVAGDLFDVFSIDEARVGICFGDVAGQGVGAGILMTAVLSYLRAGLRGRADLVPIVTRLNQYITERSPAHMFASLWVGVYVAEAHVIEYVDAGHGHWLVKRGAGAPETVGRPQSGLIGIDSDHGFESRELPFAAGDRVILYSDGIPEHRNDEGEEFGHARLIDALTFSQDPVGDVDVAMNALRAFIGPGALADDTTLASLEVQAD